AARTMRWSAASAPPGYCPASASPAVSRMYSSVPPREIAAFSASESCAPSVGSSRSRFRSMSARSRSCAPVIRPSIRPSRGGGTSARSRRPRGRPPCTARARTSSRRAPRSRAGCSRVPPALACAPGLHPIPLGIERVDAALLQQLADGREAHLKRRLCLVRAGEVAEVAPEHVARARRVLLRLHRKLPLVHVPPFAHELLRGAVPQRNLHDDGLHLDDCGERVGVVGGERLAEIGRGLERAVERPVDGAVPPLRDGLLGDARGVRHLLLPPRRERHQCPRTRGQALALDRGPSSGGRAGHVSPPSLEIRVKKSSAFRGEVGYRPSP